jgi:hypothetical protein
MSTCLSTCNARDQRIDRLGSDQVEVDGQAQGLTGKVPLTPDRFQEVVDGAKFTHGDNDLPLVIKIQKNMVAKHEHLVLKGLPAEETFGKTTDFCSDWRFDKKHVWIKMITRNG